MALKRGNHSVYELKYHVIFVTKYRRACISDEIGTFLIQKTSEILQSWNGELIEGKADKDHIHMLIFMSPKYELANYIGVLKQTLSRAVRKKYSQELTKFLWGDSFWSDSYYISSVGAIDETAVRNYIQNQGNSKSKFTKRGE